MRTIFVVIAIAVTAGSFASEATTAAERQLAHTVFFELKEDTPETRKQLVAGCQKYLAGHEGTVSFATGVVADELDREVNDRSFHVSLFVVFKNKAAQDAYQTNARHLKFIEEFSDLWAGVRVFDSYLAPKARAFQPKRIKVVKEK